VRSAINPFQPTVYEVRVHIRVRVLETDQETEPSERGVVPVTDIQVIDHNIGAPLRLGYGVNPVTFEGSHYFLDGVFHFRSHIGDISITNCRQA
jgi:hypothetical protein